MAKTLANGTVKFEQNDLDYDIHPAVMALKGLSFGDAIFPFGFQLVEIEGKMKLSPISEEQRNKLVLDVDPTADLGSLNNCALINPTQCSMGGCRPRFCSRFYNAQGRYYYCACD